MKFSAEESLPSGSRANELLFVFEIFTKRYCVDWDIVVGVPAEKAIYETVSFRELLTVLLTIELRNSAIWMLTAYFDDSGTHDDSDVVVLAGLFGGANQWAMLDEDWARILHNPCPGKGPLKRFHMVDCQIREGEFFGWSRTECDYLVRQLGDVITASMLCGYCVGISRKDWDEVITGKRRKVIGDAERFCLTSCYLMVERWASTRMRHDNQLAFVFDNRPHRAKEYQAIFDLIQSENRKEKLNLLSPYRPDFVTLTLASSAKFRPLQAADLLAWEFYQNANDVLRGGGDRPNRKQFQRLIVTDVLLVKFQHVKNLNALQ